MHPDPSGGLDRTVARRTQTYAIRLAVEGGGQVKAELVSVGQSGEQSLKRIETAGERASGGLKGLGRQAELLRTGIRTLGGGASTKHLYRSGTSSTGDHILWLSFGTTPTLRHQASGGGTVTITSSVAIVNDTRWSTIVGTWRPGRLELYVDGGRVPRVQRRRPPPAPCSASTAGAGAFRRTSTVTATSP